MGNYNPHTPQIVGQEWVPIRDAAVESDDITERGYTFRIDQATTAVSGSVWVKTPTPYANPFSAELINIYPLGVEDQTGPIRKVVIPVESVGVTGTTGFVTGTAADIADPSDAKALIMSNGSSMASLNFAVQNYSQQLFGKRILGVRLVYTSARFPAFPPFDDFDIVHVGIGMTTDLTNRRTVFQTYVEGPVVPSISNASGPLARVTQLFYVDFGAANIYVTNPIVPESTSEVDPTALALPWRYQELLLFSTTTALAQRRAVYLDAVDVESVFFGYIALEVFYCEETRVRYGGRVSSDDLAVDSAYPEGVNMIALRDTSFNIPGALPAGDYLITTTHQNYKPGLPSTGGRGPELCTLRQLYELPSHRGVVVDSRVVEGQQFTSESTDEITEITLHTATAIVTGVHAYGTQSGAPVYGSITPSQEVINLATTSVTVSQVRYYARRYGDTSVPLEIFTTAGMFLPGVVGSYASTPDTAVLDITGDIDIRADVTLPNWRTLEVFAAKLGPAGNRSWQFFLEVNGTLNLHQSPDGTSLNLFTSTLPIPINSGRLAVRVTLDVDNGAAGKTATFYTAPTIDGPWTQFGAPVVQAGTTSIFNSTAVLEVGSNNSGTGSPLTGVIHAAEVRNGIAGSVVANPNFSAQAPGTTSFTDSAGRTWTLNGLATIIAGATASITVADFDALPEIVDGWREVTLTLSTPVSMISSEFQEWLWRATGEAAGNQWQVLAASGPPGTVTTITDPAPASYQPPYGSSIKLTWQSPPVSGQGTDTRSDAVLIFSQTPLSVTGFALTTGSLAVTGALNCGLTPRCIPTAIQYNRLTWTPFGACDSFTRTSTSGWGNTESGQSWTTAGGSATDFTVNGSRGLMSLGTLSVERSARISYTLADAQVEVLNTNSALPVGGNPEYAVMLRWVDANNYVALVLFRTTANVVTVTLRQTIAGVVTDLASTAVAGLTATSDIRLKFLAQGTTLYGRVWLDGQFEPLAWTLTATTAHTAAGDARLVASLPGTLTNTLPIIIGWDDFYLIAAALVDGSLEVQRRDSLTDWKTIVLTRSPGCFIGLSDFEARVGVLSEYRVRTLNALDFVGPWVTGSATIPAPGVTVAGDGNSMLIFTNNTVPSSSLAYVMQFEGQVIESFTFPEVDTVQLQRMFGKDFFTAFHPLERGGEQFTRVLLVNAAAIALPSLANFRSLRSLAWASLDYVCVRDELGNRWFANVRVPEGTVRNNRTIYLAQIQVSEVTDTPTPIDSVVMP